MDDSSNKKMRILCIDSFNDPFSSVRPKTELIAGFKQMGMNVWVLADGPSENLEIFKHHGIPLNEYFPKVKFDKKAIRLIQELIEQHDIDVIYAGNNKAITNSIRALRGKKTILVVYRGAKGPYLQDPIAWITHLHPRVDRIACNSKYVRDFLRSQMFSEKKKAVNIYRGQRTAWYSETVPGDLQSVGVPKEAYVVGCVANIRKVKGAPYFLRAIDLLSDDPNIHFLFIGHGENTPAMKRLVKRIRRSSHIHFTGFRKDALNLVAACQAYVQPSLSEGISRSVVEAMSLSKPCIVSDAGGNPELVEHQKSGLVVPVKNSSAIAEAIKKLYQNPEQSLAYGRIAKQRIDTVFSLDATIRSFLELFRETLRE
jgi:glycosyltransferase involved in cell wall biosynthesis